jgi:CRP-like cAMP-binding protein
VFASEPHGVLATALSNDVEAVRIDARALRHGGDQEVAASAWTNMLSREAKYLEDKVGVVTNGRAERRLARLVTELVARFGQKVKGGWFLPLRLSRRDAAGLTGLTTETTSRVMSSWHKRHLVVTAPDGAYVDRKSKLEACAHSCECLPEKRRQPDCLACR